MTTVIIGSLIILWFFAPKWKWIVLNFKMLSFRRWWIAWISKQWPNFVMTTSMRVMVSIRMKSWLKKWKNTTPNCWRSDDLTTGTQGVDFPPHPLQYWHCSRGFHDLPTTPPDHSDSRQESTRQRGSRLWFFYWWLVWWRNESSHHRSLSSWFDWCKLSVPCGLTTTLWRTRTNVELHRPCCRCLCYSTGTSVLNLDQLPWTPSEWHQSRRRRRTAFTTSWRQTRSVW